MRDPINELEVLLDEVLVDELVEGLGGELGLEVIPLGYALLSAGLGV